MNELPERTKKMIERMKEKIPVYSQNLSLYERIIEEQAAEKPSITFNHAAAINTHTAICAKEGFPLIEKKDFVLDITSSVRLFESLCRVFRNVNDKMRENIQAIEEALTINALNLKELIRSHSDASA